MKTTKQRSSTEDSWKSRIGDWQQSGLSGAQYCKLHQLTYHQFIYWRQKLGVEDESSVRPVPRGFIGFTEVQLGGEAAEASGLSLTLPSGLALRGITAANLPVVVKLLEAL